MAKDTNRVQKNRLENHDEFEFGINLRVIVRVQE